MPVLKFYYPVLDGLSQGPVIRKAVAICLRAIGILVALGGAAGIIALLKLVFERGVPAEATIAGLLLAALVGAALLCVVQVCFYRARTIDLLPMSSYTVVPVVSVAIRAIGEVIATLGVAAGIGGFVAILLSGRFGAQLLSQSGLPGFFIRSSSSESSLIAAVSTLAYAAVTSFATLLFAYFAAEMILAFVDMSRQLERLAPNGSGGGYARREASVGG